jgi:hypothetical protein
MNNLTKVAAILCMAFFSIFLLFTTFAQLIPATNALPDSGTNLWLSISLSNNTVDLLLHNTQPGVAYLIRSREDLASGAWFSEGTVTGIIKATATPATISIGGRTNSLFLQAFAWMTNGTVGTPPMLAVGGERIMELTTNGDMISWGGNQYGELGDYTHLDSDDPVHVVGLTNIVKIAFGVNHALAIDAQGALWAWGDNGFGQLGDGDMDGTNVPVRVLGMASPVVNAAGGYYHSVAVKANGTVWAWGNNVSGQLGIGNTRLDIVGPVILIVANGFTANGMVGTTNHSSWLQLQVANGGFTLNGGCTVHGSVTTPAATVKAQAERLPLASMVERGGCVRIATPH